MTTMSHKDRVIADVEDVDNATGAPVFQTDQDQTVQTRHCRLRLDMMHTPMGVKF